VVILPEIWGITSFTKDMALLIQSATRLNVIVLDFYQPLGLGPIALPYDEAGTSLAMQYKEDLKGEQFLSLWQNDFSKYMRDHYPQASNIAVIGFCFGGRLSWLAGTDFNVKQIFSFYGAGPHDSYCHGLGSVEYLAANRKSKDLECYGFYGELDESISALDRDMTKQILSQQYSYQEYIFPAQHAFMNPNRPRFDADSCQKATRILLDHL
jgi:dienelactone hydrolase